jgi:hypothetical protein
VMSTMKRLAALEGAGLEQDPVRSKETFTPIANGNTLVQSERSRPHGDESVVRQSSCKQLDIREVTIVRKTDLEAVTKEVMAPLARGADTALRAPACAEVSAKAPLRPFTIGRRQILNLPGEQSR